MIETEGSGLVEGNENLGKELFVLSLQRQCKPINYTETTQCNT